MNWLVFAIFAYASLVIDTGLRDLLALSVPWLSADPLTPTFCFILLAFICVSAPPSVCYWAGLILGLLLDLSRPFAVTGQVFDVVIVGPMALGCLLGAAVGVQLRTLVFRESAVTQAIVTFVVGLFANLLAVAMLSMRGLPWPVGEPVPGFSAADELSHRFLGLVYTALLAMPVGYVLLRTSVLWSFHFGKGPTPARYRR